MLHLFLIAAVPSKKRQRLKLRPSLPCHELWHRDSREHLRSFCKPEITKSIKSKSPEARYFFFALHPKLSNNSFLKKERAD
jgi:hypothetical protein